MRSRTPLIKGRKELLELCVLTRKRSRAMDAAITPPPTALLNPRLHNRRPAPPAMTASSWMDVLREKEANVDVAKENSDDSSSEESDMSEDTKIRKRLNKADREKKRAQAEELKKQQENGMM